MRQEKLQLSTGITMNVALAGPEDAPPVILLHGFPESHRTWRELAPLLSGKLRLVMANERKPIDPQRIGQREQVGEQRLGRIGSDLLQPVAVAEPPLVRHD